MEKKGINKNIYRLWYEYLKRSDDYNRLCELIRGEKTAFDPPKTLEESINFNKNLLSFLKNNPGLYSDKGFRLPLDTFIYNGDLFSMTFNKWYKYKLKWEHYRKNFEYDEEIPVKLVDRNYIDSYLEVLEKKTLKKYRREPTLSEVKDLLELILGPNSSILSFIVDVNFVDNLNFSKNINALTNKFKKI